MKAAPLSPVARVRPADRLGLFVLLTGGCLVVLWAVVAYLFLNKYEQNFTPVDKVAIALLLTQVALLLLGLTGLVWSLWRRRYGRSLLWVAVGLCLFLLAWFNFQLFLLAKGGVATATDCKTDSGRL